MITGKQNKVLVLLNGYIVQTHKTPPKIIEITNFFTAKLRWDGKQSLSIRVSVSLGKEYGM